jgi:hypothetical protein
MPVKGRKRLLPACAALLLLLLLHHVTSHLLLVAATAVGCSCPARLCPACASPFELPLLTAAAYV